ncbi:uncharacterized protein METZ01_LOCUS37752 [marine metagenome]|uniref:Uncharacterized protein n=1 Tax=marine metagenome TaxID=408172 RepID=A0A381R229_9ZZZZ
MQNLKKKIGFLLAGHYLTSATIVVTIVQSIFIVVVPDSLVGKLLNGLLKDSLVQVKKYAIE